jgi:hypothetical protein
MTIEIIRQRLASGAFQDAEEVIFEALQASEKPLEDKTLSELFGRDKAPGRPVDL